MSDETGAPVREHYDDEQVAASASVINPANRLGVLLRRQGGSSEPGTFEAAAD
ncbi:hypothetical protein ACTWPB_17685 [Nocardia sp. IBHARD005]|uniref:hypothetical protein n=1 Tax=Nocardia sp. IBHARD005 TaxID=3457765 RepID=UPI0040582715